MQIHAITGTNKDMWREEGRDKEGEAGRGKERGEKKGESHPGQFLLRSMPSISWLPRRAPTSAHPPHCLLLSSSLYSVPSDDSTSVALLCPRSWQNLSKDRKFREGGGRWSSPTACALQRHVPEAWRQETRCCHPVGWSEGLCYVYCLFQSFFSSTQLLKPRALAH